MERPKGLDNSISRAQGAAEHYTRTLLSVVTCMDDDPLRHYFNSF